MQQLAVVKRKWRLKTNRACCVTAERLLLNNAVVFILILSVCCVTHKNKSIPQFLLLFLCVGSLWTPCYCQSLKWIMKLYEMEREILSVLRSRGWGPVTSVILSGQTQHWARPGISHRDCSVRTAHCTPEIVGSFNRISRSLQPKPALWIEFFKLGWLMIALVYILIQYSRNDDTADILSPLSSPLLSPHGENPQVRPSHSSGRQSFT